MAKRKRLGDDPTEIRMEQIRKGAGLKKSERRDVETSELLIKKNFYMSKSTGDLIQKVTIHLPYSLVKSLKQEALDSRKTLSEIIRERLR